MQHYRCKCGARISFGSMPPDRCYACPECGSDLAQGPNLHREPLPHDYSSHVEQMGVDGPVKVPVCRYCHRPRWEIESGTSEVKRVMDEARERVRPVVEREMQGEVLNRPPRLSPEGESER